MQTWTLIFSGVAAFGTIFGLLAWRASIRAERRSLEVRDVVWERSLEDGEWHFTHSGSTPVSEVKIVLTVDGKSEITRIDKLNQNTALKVSNTEHSTLAENSRAAEAAYARELEETERAEAMPSLFEGFIPSYVMPPPLVKVPVSAIITWRHPSGVPGTYEMTWTQEY